MPNCKGVKCRWNTGIFGEQNKFHKRRVGYMAFNLEVRIVVEVLTLEEQL